MSARLTPSDAQEEAERWFARLMAPDCTREEREEFLRWRQASADHAQAYVATEDLLGRVDVLAASDARMSGLLARAREVSNRDTRWRWGRALALAASVAGVATMLYVGGAQWWGHGEAVEYLYDAG